MNFDLPLQAEKVKPHQSVALHIIIALALLSFGIISYVFYAYTYVASRAQSPMFDFKLWGIILLITGAFLLIVTLFRKRWLLVPKNNLIFRIIELLVCSGFIIFSLLHSWKIPAGMFGFISLSIIFAIIWEKTGKNSLMVLIGEEGIQLPATSRNRFLEWVEVNKLMYRYGTLTIDCTDNKLYQWHMADAAIDIKALEEFCGKKIEENKNKRIKEW